jgi:hypothetical protein
VTMGSAMRTHSLSKKKNSLSWRIGTAQTASKMVHGCPRLVIAGRGVREVVRRVQDRTIPQFVKIAVKLICAGLGDVIDLGGSIAALIHGIRKSVDGDFRD